MQIFKTTPRQKGFSLIELMLSMAIGTILLTGFLHWLLSIERTDRTVQALLDIQERGRFSLMMISQAIRNAGYSGCPLHGLNTQSIVVNRNNQAPWFSANDLAAKGYLAQEAERFLGAIDENTDVLVTYSLDFRKPFLLKYHDERHGIFYLQHKQHFKQGDIFVAQTLDCQARAEFMVSKTKNYVSHEMHYNTKPVKGVKWRNCSIALGGNGYACSKKPQIYHFPENSQIYSQTSASFFIRNKALFKRLTNQSASEIVKGVENLQLTFGLDSNADGVVDIYQTTEKLSNWHQVKSIRVALLLRSLWPIYSHPKSLTYNGVKSNKDRYLRKFFKITLLLHNKQPAVYPQ